MISPFLADAADSQYVLFVFVVFFRVVAISITSMRGI